MTEVRFVYFRWQGVNDMIDSIYHRGAAILSGLVRIHGILCTKIHRLLFNWNFHKDAIFRRQLYREIYDIAAYRSPNECDWTVTKRLSSHATDECVCELMTDATNLKRLLKIFILNRLVITSPGYCRFTIPLEYNSCTDAYRNVTVAKVQNAS